MSRLTPGTICVETGRFSLSKHLMHNVTERPNYSFGRIEYIVYRKDGEGM